MLTRVHVKGFRCLEDVDFGLTPLHAFVGPNDSGKSTLLDALAVAADWARLVRGMDGHQFVEWIVGDEKFGIEGFGAESPPAHYADGSQDPGIEIHPLALRAYRLELEPREMRQPCALLADGDALSLGRYGRDLAGVLDVMNNRGDDAFAKIRDEVRRLFPHVQLLRLENTPQNTKAVTVKLIDGTVVPAAELSEGLLYWLAFSVLGHMNTKYLYLVEEPENGLHPSRIREVVQVFRALVARGNQVILATHSPLLLNELQPEEISVVTRPKGGGTRVTPFAKVPDLDRLLEIYKPGELWVALADGETETALFRKP